jgi:hypothetical protein
VIVSESGIISAEELLVKEMHSSEAIIEGLVWERDNIFIVGSEKVGKSILALQFAFCLTSGQPLFGEYRVRTPMCVLYVQTEGKLADTRDRISEMLKANDCETANLFIAFFPHVSLDTGLGLDLFVKAVEDKGVRPNVIILDPLYHSMQGSLIDEEDSRRMTANLRVLGARYSATIIVVHHTHKPIRMGDGRLINEGDNAIFGSFVWKAWADHVLLFTHGKEKNRILSCQTQRSGKVVEYEELALTGDPYLGFDRQADRMRPFERSVFEALRGAGLEGITRSGLVDATKLSLTAVEKSLRRLILERCATKTKKRPVVYTITESGKDR